MRSHDDFLPRFPWQSGRDFCALPETQRAINSSSVYRSVSTDRYGVLLSFMIYAALSSGPQQWVPRPFEFIYRLYIPSFSSLHHFAPPPTSTSTSARFEKSLWTLKSLSSPCVTGKFFFSNLLRSTIVTERCDRRSCSLISRLMSLLITRLLPAFILFVGRLHSRSRAVFIFFSSLLVYHRKKRITCKKKFLKS